MKHGEDLFGILCRHLAELGLAFETHPEGEAIRFLMKGGSGRQFVLMRTIAMNRVVLIRSRIDCTASRERLIAVAELIARVNHGFRVGGFQVDFSDGEISFASGFELRDGELTKGMVEGLVSTAITTTERFMPAFDDVLFCRRTSVDALRAIDDSTQ